MTIRESILQGVRTWLKAAATLTDAQVIPADDVGPRPAMPYLTVKVLSADLQVGEDDPWPHLVLGVPKLTVRGNRSGSVSVQSFGAAAEEWLATARLSLRLPAIQEVLRAAGLTIVPDGAARDITAVRDTRAEPRFVWDLAIQYVVTSAAATETEATSVVLTEIIDSAPSDLTQTRTLPL